ncbi:MAG: hypothetical protein IK018_05240 [Lachnospiraceae bacterium]|nr:hypothetical protein [Lachnospiraceae bacterium]MBR5993188.1 hypothetical protein [Lachnospiraceae bacterium]
MSENNRFFADKFCLLRTLLIIILSGVSVFSFGVIYKYTYPEGYHGDEIIGFQPIGILLFIVLFFLLNRFMRKEVLRAVGRIIISCIMGLLLSLASLYSTLMLYGNNTIFSSGFSFVARLLLILGMALFYVPMTSELVGLCDLLIQKNASAAEAETSVRFYEKNNILYFFIVWGIVFLSFVPLFLYSFPVNFVYDAGYQVYEYVNNTLSMHHPLLHTVFLGFCYNLGYQKNDPTSGFILYTLVQMLTLSASFAFFLKYVKEKGASRCLRIALLLMFVLNPTNPYFAISTIKGVFSTAFLIFALTFLMKIFDGRKPVLNSILFTITAILSCLFRNNMIYAMVIAGILTVILRKGIGKRIHILVLTALICVGYLGSDCLLSRAAKANYPSITESMSVPLMCLARTYVNHKDELDPDTRDRILAYIDEDAMAQYSLVIADPIKGGANEKLIRKYTADFLKFFVKVGSQYPGEYVEAICGLTLGYYTPINSPYFLTGITKLYTMGIPGGFPSPEISSKLPIGNAVMHYLYKDESGRLEIPVFGMFWRCAVYFWTFIFAFLYLIYRKKPGNLCILLFPLMYMLSCLLGPVSFLRYICINTISLPIVIYLIMSEDLAKE